MHFVPLLCKATKTRSYPKVQVTCEEGSVIKMMEFMPRAIKFYLDTIDDKASYDNNTDDYVPR
jgi:hypothetical protein